MYFMFPASWQDQALSIYQALSSRLAADRHLTGRRYGVRSLSSGEPTSPHVLADLC